jgi:hypothetical protein
LARDGATWGAHQLSADASEVVAVQKIGVAICSDGEDQLLAGLGARDVEENWRGPTNIDVWASRSFQYVETK